MLSYLHLDYIDIPILEKNDILPFYARPHGFFGCL